LTAGRSSRPTSILGLDCGSTTTKAALYARNEDGRLVLVGRRDAPTTVEAPLEDVIIGVRQAVAALEETVGRKLLSPAGDGFITPESDDGRGVDAVVATSSAGGGLRVLVAGVIRGMTAESAERAALGAGAIVSEVIAVDDGRRPHERLERIRQVEPDMILLAGGVDGGNVSHVTDLAELIFTAGPSPRFASGETDHLPIVFAGNPDAARRVREILGRDSVLSSVANIRPRLEQENVLPAKREMQELFMRHVMAHAPGYDQLVTWVDAITPTPAAVGLAVEMVAQSLGEPILAVDVGGATTDVFSVHDGRLFRSVTANVGLSYSALNLLGQVGADSVNRWLGRPRPELELGDIIGNKTLRPTTLPETAQDLELEQALAREALRVSLARHREIVVGLKGVHQERDLSNVFDQPPTGLPLTTMSRLKAVIGSGGVLSKAPEAWQVAAMLVDGLEPGGVTELYYDRGFLFPNVGAAARVSPEVAREMLFGQALVPLGTVIAPETPGRRLRARRKAAVKVLFTPPGEPVREFDVSWGSIRVLHLPAGCRAGVKLQPLAADTDVGAGPGQPVTGMVAGGLVGLIIDTRGRPLHRPGDPNGHLSSAHWARAVRQAEATSGPAPAPAPGGEDR